MPTILCRSVRTRFSGRLTIGLRGLKAFQLVVTAVAALAFNVVLTSAAQAQLHGCGSAKNCVNANGEGQSAQVGDTIDCLIGVSNEDDFGHLIRISTITDCVRHFPPVGDVCAGELVPGSIDPPGSCELVACAENPSGQCIRLAVEDTPGDTCQVKHSDTVRATDVVSCTTNADCGTPGICFFGRCMLIDVGHGAGTDEGTTLPADCGSPQSAICIYDCQVDADCTQPTNPCQRAVCDTGSEATLCDNRCEIQNLADSDTPPGCTDTDNNACTSAGCDGLGNCDQLHNIQPSEPCADTDGNTCTSAGCNTAGQCDQNHGTDQPSTPCPDTDNNSCTSAGCDEQAQCDQSHNIQPNESCADTDNNSCTSAGCDAAGTCDQSHVIDPPSTPCEDTGNECAAAGCDAAGSCAQNQTPVQDGTPCTDSDQSQCTDAACVAGQCDQDAGGVVQCVEPECQTCDPADGVCKPIAPAPPQCGSEICANGVDDDGDGLIDCEDPMCDCLPIGEDPGKITFGKPRGSGRDMLRVHGLILPLTAYDPMTEEVGFVLTNDVGLAYSAVIPAGAIEQTRFKFKHLNRANARAKNGVGRFLLSRKFVQRGEFEGYQFNVTTYGDLSLATVPRMTFQIRVGDDAFINTSDWKWLRNGWKLTLPRD